jgi:4-cresol dehydrogenase (hydroxylating)
MLGMSPISQSQVLEAFRGAVGKTNVVTDSKSLHEAQTTTYKTDQKVLGIVRPGSSDKVQKVVTIARQKRIPIYVYSTGKNWGYGSRVPQANNSLLVDLGRMNKILDYNEELGYVTVEPGVTQQQLYDFLKEKGAPFGLSTTGSAADTSIIGNICERGVGVGPYGFRSHYVGGLEVILPSGKCIHTGFGRFANARAAAIHPEGIGPSFYDMFLQSNYGIITKLTMFLAPTPAYSRFIDISITEDKDLGKYLDVLLRFNFYSTSRKLISFRNDLQMILAKTQYPWRLTNNETPLSAEAVDQLKRKYDIDYAWKALVVIYGYTRQEVTAQINYFKSLTKQMEGITVSPLYNENTLGNRPRGLSSTLYWRMRTEPPTIKNPDTDGCGLIRLSMAVPFTAADIASVIGIMRRVIIQFKYEPLIEGHCISERTVVVVAPILFDRTIAGEDANALECHDTLLRQLMEAGYYPYRDNGRAMTLFPSSSDDYDSFQTTIKNAVDPDNILSPGRYESA